MSVDLHCLWCVTNIVLFLAYHDTVVVACCLQVRKTVLFTGGYDAVGQGSACNHHNVLNTSI